MTFHRASAERNEPVDFAGAKMLVLDAERFGVDGTKLLRVPYSGGDAILLGREDGVALFAGPHSESETMLDFRAALAALEPDEVSLLSYARGMMQWAARTRFCSACGGELEVRRAGHMRFCGGCNAEHYPRLDPAVMMLVTHRDRLLLARHLGRGAKFWSTLAGFVEPGETLEQAAARELHEETGLVAKSMRYFGSQPWPLPASLMIGFVIEVEDDTLTIDTSELAEARWVTREELAELTTSSTISLSGQMIAAWREAERRRPGG